MISTGIRHANRPARAAEIDQGILVFVQKFCAHDRNRSDYQAWAAGLSKSQATNNPEQRSGPPPRALSAAGPVAPQRPRVRVVRQRDAQ